MGLLDMVKQISLDPGRSFRIVWWHSLVYQWFKQDSTHGREHQRELG